MKMALTNSEKWLALVCFMFLLVFCISSIAETTPALSLNESSITLAKGKTAKLTPSVSNVENAKKLKYVWESSDPAVATVSNGTVKAIDSGSAIITCSTTLENGISIQDTIYVKVIIPLKKISLSDKQIKLAVDTYWKVDCTFEPQNATNQNVTWSSSNSDVASVNDSGYIVGVSEGNAKITATSQDGNNRAVVNVTVKKYDIVFKSREAISITGKDLRSERGCVDCKKISSTTFGASWEVKPVKIGEDIISYLSNYAYATSKTPTKETVYVAQYALQPEKIVPEKNEKQVVSKNEILFREIPWESSVYDSIEKLQESTPLYVQKIDTSLYEKQFSDWPEPVKVISIRFKILGLKVAGFPAEDVTLYFLPEISNDLNSYSKTDGRLIAAEYNSIEKIEGKSWNGTYEEIKKKLDILYGEHDNDEWVQNGVHITIGTTTHDERRIKSKALDNMLNEPIGKNDYYSASVMDGYRLIYSCWSDSVQTKISTIKDIDNQAEAAAQKKLEQERLEREKKQKEEEENAEEVRGFDGL